MCTPPPQSALLALFGGAILDHPFRARPAPGWLLVRHGRIEDIAWGLDRPARWPAVDEEHRLPRATLMAGLIDAHVHVTQAGDGASDMTVGQPQGLQREIARRSAQRSIAAGITTVRDCGAPAPFIHEFARIAWTDHAVSRVLACGPPITPRRGHAWQLGGEADDASEVSALAERLVDEGARCLKVMASGGGSRGTHPWTPTFSTATLRALVEIARTRAVPVTAHCLSGEALARSVSAGVRQVEHAKFRNPADDGSAYDPRVVELMAATGTSACPTLSVAGHILANAEGVDAATLEVWRRRMAYDMQHFAAMVEAGVTVVAGTDAGWRHTPSDALHDELGYMIDAGLPVRQAIAAATTNAAVALGIDDQIGRLRPGLLADAIAIGGDPVSRPELMRQPVMILKGGRVVHATATGALWDAGAK